MLVGVPFVAYSSGILIVYALGSFLHWRLAAWCGLLLPMLSFMAILVAPESPTWLARKGYYEKARKGRKKNPLIKLRSLSFSGRLTVHPLKAPIKINNFSPFSLPHSLFAAPHHHLRNPWCMCLVNPCTFYDPPQYSPRLAAKFR